MPWFIVYPIHFIHIVSSLLSLLSVSVTCNICLTFRNGQRKKKITQQHITLAGKPTADNFGKVFGYRYKWNKKTQVTTKNWMSFIRS